MPAITEAKRVQERDLTAQLRGLVDGCFEEGQYDAGLAALDQLRSSNYRPAPAHIRQLICIALRASKSGQDAPSSPPKKTKGKGVDLPPSLNQQKASLLPSDAATETARKLLFSFALTNSPASLFRALPSYPLELDYNASAGRSDGVDLALDGEDSYLARVAQCVGSATNVWELIKPRFVKWDDPAATRISGKTRKRRSVVKEESDDLPFDDEVSVAVAEDAWPVLSWFVLIFEKDESQTTGDEKSCYSPLLLSTIPSTRSRDPRWDVSAPLDVVFCCLSYQDEERKSTGVKLLHQLINLTSTTSFDLQLFVNALYLRVPIEDWDNLGPLIANLPNSMTVLHFRLHLCMKYLNEVSRTRDAAPAPARRAQPRVRGAREQAPIPPDSTDAERSIIRTYSLPSWLTTVQPLLSAALGTVPDALSYVKIKFNLLTVYGSLQSQQPPSQRDAAWVASLNDGALYKIVDAAFGGAALRAKDEKRESQVLGQLLVSLMSSFGNGTID